MKWLKKIVIKWVRNDWENANKTEKSLQLVATRDVDSVQDDPILNFRVFNAVGGRVVEFNSYDKRSDRRNSTTYIITSEQDFGERIAKIAMMESLKS